MRQERDAPIRLVFRDESRRGELEPLCTAVLEHYPLASQPLCCVFDDEERDDFTSAFTESYCGFFYPIAQFGFRNGGFPWPWQIESNVKEVWTELENGGPFLNVALVYIRKKTSDRATGTAITFAHELQHLMQYLNHYKAWRAYGWLETVTRSENSVPWFFPTEYEAQLVSKRVAEAVLGLDEVARYTSERIEAGDDPHKWQFFQELDVSQHYDFVDQTRRMVERYRGKLDALYREQPRGDSEPDFTRAVWWE